MIAVACRLAGAGDRLVLDEGYTWLVGSAGDPSAFLDRLAAFENTPPLYYLLLTPLDLGDEVAIRWPALAAGVLTVPLTFALARSLAGGRAGLLAALVVAVAPYQVATADLARAFTLATAGLLAAAWALAELNGGARARWWYVYAAGATVAIWSEYYAVLTLVPLLLAAAWLGRIPRRTLAVAGIAPLATMVPWLGQLRRGLDLDGVTKVIPRSPGTSPAFVRDELVPLFAGDRGGPAVRTVLLVALLAGLVAAWRILRRQRSLVALTGGVAAGTLVAHLVAAQFGFGVFERRYLGVLLPLLAAFAAPALSRRLTAAVAVAALALGAAVFAGRAGRELEPDYAAVARAARVPLVLTNSPVVRYYLGGRVRLDRPFGLGPGEEGAAPLPYAVVDDAEVGSGPRPGPGRRLDLGRISVRVVGR